MPEIDVLFAGVAVAELASAVQWYASVFGRAPDIVPNDDEVMWQCSAGGWLYVIQDPQRAGRALVTLAVADLERLVADVASRGIAGTPIERVGDAGHKATFTDPDGNVVAFIEVNAPDETAG